MENNPDEQASAQIPPQSPIQLHLYTDEHGWTTIDPNVPLAQQPIAASWFARPNPQNQDQPMGYRAVFVESNVLNPTEPHQRGLYFTTGQPPSTVTNDNTTAHVQGQPLNFFPSPPPPPEFPPFPPHIPNPWQGSFSGTNAPPPFPLFRSPLQSRPGTNQVTVRTYPVPPNFPFSNPQTLPPWPTGFTVTSAMQHPPPDSRQSDADKTVQRPPNFHNQSNMNFHPMSIPVYREICKFCEYGSEKQRTNEEPRIGSLCGGDWMDLCCDCTDRNAQNSNFPQRHEGREKNDPWNPSDDRNTRKYLPCSDACTVPHIRHPSPIFSCGMADSPHHIIRSASLGPTHRIASESDNIQARVGGTFSKVMDEQPSRPRSACPPIDYTHQLSPETNQKTNYWSFQRRQNYDLPPPPCQCCPCSDKIARDPNKYAILLLQSGGLSAIPLKYSASSEVLPDQIVRFGSTDLNATHTMEAVDQSGSPQKSVVFASNFVQPMPAGATKRDSIDSILTAFTKAAWKNLDKEMERLETLQEED